MTIAWRTVAALAAAVALAACSGGDRPDPGATGTRAAAAFRAGDLRRLVLTPAEVPPGLERFRPLSGPMTATKYADNFTESRAERRKLRQLRLLGAYTAVYGQREAFEALADDRTPPGGTMMIFSLALRFPDGKSASRALAYERLLSRSDEDASAVRALVSRGLGEESFGLRATVRGLPSPAIQFGWRVRNVVLFAVSFGGRSDWTPGRVRRLAEVMNARAP